jgi:hypothetical protein
MDLMAARIGVAKMKIEAVATELRIEVEIEGNTRACMA